MKVNAVTYFSREFLVQGVVSINSLLQVDPECRVFVVCMDQASFNYLVKRFSDKDVSLFLVSEVIEFDLQFREILNSRSFFEALITLKPIILEYFLNQIEVEGWLIYFDADVYFFRAISSRFELLDDSDLLLSEHLFPSNLKANLRYGKFNAGFLAIRNSKRGKEVVLEWKNLCLTDSSINATENVYGDQKYLERFENTLGVRTLKDPGVNNGQYYFQAQRKIKNVPKSKLTFIDDYTLICFHFHGIRIGKNFISTGFNRYKKPHKAVKILRFIYLPYINNILHETSSLSKALPNFFEEDTTRNDIDGNLHNLVSLLRFTILPTILHKSKRVRKTPK